ncbi:MAG: DapH/DapD/GlmU-related protein [Xenococcaceae cyanobacterium MO_188.B32]|nr:DapH/DapD/GlmU-related protein [Xenococcaceae cyanobacterium MO_188.B32]
MKDRKKQSNSLWLYRKESILTALVEWIPRAPGVVMRNWVYRSLFAKMGHSVRIQPGVEFIQPRYIEIGDNVTINREVYISSADENKTQIGNNSVCLEEQVNLGYGVQISTFGKNSQIYLKKKVILDRGVDLRSLNEGYIEIDECVYIGPYSCVAGPGPVKIGKSCLIGSHSGIYGNNHNFADPKHEIREQGITFKGITIEEDCWLGTGAKVLDGVTIGQGSVIGAGAVVTKDIPSYSVAVGVPAKVIAQRNELISQHQKLNGTKLNGLKVPEVRSST